MGDGVETNGKSHMPKDINVIQLVNPFAFRMPDMIGLFDEAFGHDMFASTEDMILRLQAGSVSGSVVVFVGQELVDQKWKWNALMVIILPTLLSQPQVFHFYCNGSGKLRRALIDKGVEWFREHGYNGFMTSNTTSQPDSAFKRLFKRAGEPEKLGTLFKFEV